MVGGKGGFKVGVGGGWDQGLYGKIIFSSVFKTLQNLEFRVSTNSDENKNSRFCPLRIAPH